MALQNIPPPRVKSILVDSASERVLRSFSRRLGYLADGREARAIVKAWLAPGGLLSDVTNFNELRRAMFANVAPVAPEAVLAALENALPSADEDTLRRCTHFVRLLRSLAYEQAFFERAIALLVKFAVLSSDDHTDNQAVGVVESLFYIVLSGTHAPVDARVKAAEGLLGSADARIRSLGVKTLEALMQSSHFTSHYEFDFGARSRDYGSYPQTGADVRAWFETVINLAGSFALSDRPVADDVKNAVAREFRGLWSNAGCVEELDQLARAIAAKSFWRDGWIATRQTRIFDSKGMGPELRDRLIALEEFLRPKDLASKVRGLVVGARRGSLDVYDLGDDEEEDDDTDVGARYSASTARSAAAIQDLGHDVAADDGTFKTLLPELMNGDHRLSAFGMALAESAENLSAMWDAIVAQFGSTKKAGIQLLGGFLNGLQKRDEALADIILDEALEHAPLAEVFPDLQAAVTVDHRAVARLHRALDLEKAPMQNFYSLAYGRACDELSGPEFRDLVVAMANKPDGCPVGLEMISMRLYSDRSAKREPLPEVREAGRIVLSKFAFQRNNGHTTREDHKLGVVVAGSCAGPLGISVARSLCRKFLSAAAKHEIKAYDFNDLMKGLLQVHPVAILDELFSGDAGSRKASAQVLSTLRRFRHPVLDVVPDEILLGWCDCDPALRYPLAAAVATLFKRPKEGEPHEWMPLTGKLLEKRPIRDLSSTKLFAGSIR